MGKLGTALWAEGLKILRGKIFWIILVAFSFFPVLLGVMMFVLKNPELAHNTGLLGAKAQLMGEANWSSYFSILSQVIAAAGLMGFGFITSWVFGREYSDRTVKDLLALPVSRSLIVWAKFIVIILWCVLLSLEILGLGLLAGKIVDIGGWSSELFFHGLNIFLVTSVLTITLSTPVAFFASYGRGYLPPLGFVIIVIIIAQFIATLGHGAYFPWAVPALYSGAAGPGSAQLEAVSFIIVFITGIIGILATFLWWRFADHS